MASSALSVRRTAAATKPASAGDQADDRQRERVLGPEQRAEPDGVAVADEVLDVLLEHEADGHDGKETRPGGGERASGRSRSAARSDPKRGNAAPKRAQAEDGRRAERRSADGGQDQAGDAPVVVARVAKGARRAPRRDRPGQGRRRRG